MRWRAFTLLELILATALAGALLGGVLAASSRLSREGRALAARAGEPRAEDVFGLIRRDLINAASIRTVSSDLILRGYGGIDPRTLSSTSRLIQVSYRVRPGVGLVRQQEYLDDLSHPARWSELVLCGATQLEAQRIARSIRLRIQMPGGRSIEQTFMVQ
jgi:hypothetical protein